MAESNTDASPLDIDAAVDLLLTPKEDSPAVPSKDEVTAEDETEAPVTAVNSEQTGKIEDEDVEAIAATSEEEDPEEEESDEEEVEPETTGEEEEEPDAEEEEEDEADTEVLYTLADGTEATLDDLKRGNLRNADYTQKTQALAEERQAFEQDRQSVGQERQALAESLMMSMNMVEPQLVKGAQTDWQALQMEDAYAYAEQWAEYQQAQVRYSQLQQRGETLTQQQSQENRGKESAYAAEQGQALKLALPDLADPTKAKALQTQIRDYAVASGLSENEVTGIKDHRVIIMLNKARLYDDMVSAGKTVATKKLNKSPKQVLKKGQPISKAEKQTAARNDKLANVKRTGSVDAGVDWLLSGS